MRANEQERTSLRGTGERGKCKPVTSGLIDQRSSACMAYSQSMTGEAISQTRCRLAVAALPSACYDQ